MAPLRFRRIVPPETESYATAVEAMTNSARSRLKVDAEAYEDALDTLTFYTNTRPEWKPVLRAIRSYVSTLESTVGLHEPGL